MLGLRDWAPKSPQHTTFGFCSLEPFWERWGLAGVPRQHSPRRAVDGRPCRSPEVGKAGAAEVRDQHRHQRSQPARPAPARPQQDSPGHVGEALPPPPPPSGLHNSSGSGNSAGYGGASGAGGRAAGCADACRSRGACVLEGMGGPGPSAPPARCLTASNRQRPAGALLLPPG